MTDAPPPAADAAPSSAPRRLLSRRAWWVLGLCLAPLAAGLILVCSCAILNGRTPSNTDLATSALLAAPPPVLDQPVTLKAVTFNIWGLYAVSRHRLARMHAIAEKLRELNPDIVGFQEAWVHSDHDILADGLKEIGLIHREYYPSGLVGSGLLVLSRWPIAEAFFHRYTKQGYWYRFDQGDYWAAKGVCLARIELPGGGLLDFFNTHAQAGYGVPEYRQVRLVQMREHAEFVNAAATGSAPVLCAGDFNTRPGREDYQALVGGADLDRLTSTSTGIDSILARRSPHYAYEVLEVTPIRQTVHVGEDTVGLSDHTGYMVTLRILPRRPRAETYE